MSTNRFNYLELGETPWPAKPSPSDDESKSPGEGEPMGPAHVHTDQPDPVLETPKLLKAKSEQLPWYGEPTSGKQVYDEFAAKQWAKERDAEAETTAALTSYLGQQSDHPVSGPSVTTQIKAVETFGSRGAKAGEFNFPMGLAVDRAGILFVADLHNHRIQRITPDGGVAIVGTKGTGRSQFLAPVGVACDVDRAFYVVEQGNHRVQKFSVDGVLQFVFGREGKRNGEFTSPTGICISPSTGEILVTDSGNARVQRFNLSGEFLGAIGAKGSIQPPLANPQSVTCDNMGNIYVADTLANRIARYDPLGRFTGHFGGNAPKLLGPNVSGRFAEPRALACTYGGKLLVAEGDTGSGKLVVMDATSGVVETTVVSPTKQLGKLSRPSGVAISPRLRTGMADGFPRTDAYLADTMNHRIIRFECR